LAGHASFSGPAQIAQLPAALETSVRFTHQARLVKGLAKTAAELGYRLEPTTVTGT
jgi:hypothetical protein